MQAIGEYAKGFFDQLVQRIEALSNYDREEIVQLHGLIAAIDEAFIRNKLIEQLVKAERRLIPTDVRERRIQELQRQIEQLRQFNEEEADHD